MNTNEQSDDGKTPVTLEGLRTLASVAKVNGTTDLFIGVVLEWAGLANDEIARLRAALASQQPAAVSSAMVDRFLTWPVPADVHPDGTPGKPGRTGTNLLTAQQARIMLEHVLAVPPSERLEHGVTTAQALEAIDALRARVEG